MDAYLSEPAEDGEPDETPCPLRSAGAGGAELFEELYARAAAPLYAWTRIRLARLSAGHLQADDVLQEVWLRALEAFPSFDSARASFRGWLVGIAKNVLLEEHRRAWPLRPRHPPGGPVSGDGESMSRLDRCPDSVTSITSRLARDELLQTFLERVRELDALDGTILLHLGFEDFSAAETATRVGLSVEVVRKRWQRLRAKLCAGGIGHQLLSPRADSPEP